MNTRQHTITLNVNTVGGRWDAYTALKDFAAILDTKWIVESAMLHDAVTFGIWPATVRVTAPAHEVHPAAPLLRQAVNRGPQGTQASIDAVRVVKP